MGTCFSSRIKAESSCSTGTNSRNGVLDRNVRSSSTSSKGSSASVPPAPRSQKEILQSCNLRSYSFSDLKAATKNFRANSVVGEGGFGLVFKGWVDEHSSAPAKPGTGMVIAVKRLNQDGLQGHKEWLAEVNYLGQLQHPNVVRLVGYCLEGGHRLLAYEFMSRGSLENHLFRKGSMFHPLPWNVRVKVALGAAKGLAFLHSAEPKVIFCDLKSSNILLDSDFNAKLSDFGFAKNGPEGDKSHVSTRVVGTYGYTAPEYLATGHLSTRSDVYSYGVVLLELMSGRRAVDMNRPGGEQSLVEWAKPWMRSKRKVFRIMDKRMGGMYPSHGAHKTASLALACLSVHPKHRPTMDSVVFLLESISAASL